MTKKIFQNYDFAGNQIIDWLAENLGANPSTGKAGRVFFNTAQSALMVDDGTTIKELLTTVAWADIIGKPSTFTPSAHSHIIADTTGLQSVLEAKAPLASPTFTGVPLAPTAAASTNTTQIATTAFVQGEVASSGAGDMTKAVYDPNNDGKVSNADTAIRAYMVPWQGIVAKPSTFPPSTHTHTAAGVTDFGAEVEAKIISYWDSIAGTDANVDTIREVLNLVLQNAGAVTKLIGRYDEDIGDGSSTSIPVTHNLNSLDVVVEVYEISSGETIGCGVTRTNANVVTIEALPAPAANALRVVIRR